MRISEPNYHWYLEEYCASKMLIRQLNECVISSADPLVLILDDPTRCKVALFEYDTDEERENDIRLLLNIRDDNGGASALSATLVSPDVPPRSPGYSKPLPMQKDDIAENN